METELIIEGCGFPPLSARGCSQELNLVEQGEFRRTINGELAYLGPAVHKYRSLIRCEDKVTLVNEGVLTRGAVVRVGCLQRLWQKTNLGVNLGVNLAGNLGGNQGHIKLEREAVLGSVVAIDAVQRPVSVEMLDCQTALLHPEGDDESLDVFISYRPWLVMRVISLRLSTDEWGLKAGWKLEMEEV